jgi:hypothetical protein
MNCVILSYLDKRVHFVKAIRDTFRNATNLLERKLPERGTNDLSRVIFNILSIPDPFHRRNEEKRIYWKI